MSAWEELRGILINGSPVTAAGDRVRTDAGNEDDAYPFVIGRRVAVERTFGLDNTLLEHKETYSLECWGETRDQASDLEDQVVTLLVGAGLPPDPNGPDGIDPLLRHLRVCVVVHSSDPLIHAGADLPHSFAPFNRRTSTARSSAGRFIGEALSSRR